MNLSELFEYKLFKNKGKDVTDKELEALFLRQAIYLPRKMLRTFSSEHGRYVLCLKLIGLMETAYIKRK